MKYSPAFTLIEILVVVALLGIFAVGGFFAITTARENQLVHQSGEQVSDIFRRASIYSQNARNERTWGIKTDDRKSYTLISLNDEGEQFVESTFTLPESLTFSESFIVWFDKGTGAVPSDRLITVQSPHGKTSIISLKTNTTITVSGP